MSYFNDVRFLAGDIVRNCRTVLDRRFADTYSLEFMLSGKMFFGVDGGQQVILTAPTLFWHHPSHSYQYGAVDDDGWYHHWILMSGERIRRMIEQGLEPVASCGWIAVRQPAVVATEFTAMVEIINSGNTFRHRECAARLEFLVARAIDWAEAPGGNEYHTDKIEELCARLRRECELEYDFEQEAAGMGLSYSHFRRLFRKRAGRPPHDYLLYCRMQAAARDLRHGRKSVKEIAFQTGFEDPAAFSRMFKKKMGVSPVRFRDGIPI